MRTKLVIFLLIVLIFGAFFFLDRVFISRDEPSPNVQPELEEIPENLFREVQISYYGKNNRYKVDTQITEIVQQSGMDVNFKDLHAELKETGRLIHKLQAREGLLTNDQGILRLTGPVVIKNEGYHLSMDKLDLDLNQGLFTAQGEINFTADQIEINAQKMDADFGLTKIHFSGRPQLTLRRSDRD